MRADFPVRLNMVIEYSRTLKNRARKQAENFFTLRCPPLAYARGSSILIVEVFNMSKSTFIPLQK
jgi:hypothetical protein